MEMLPGETLQQYFARLKKLRGGSLLGTAGMMDQPVTPPTVESIEVAAAPLGQVVVGDPSGGGGEDVNYGMNSMTPEEIIARQVERLQDKGVGYDKAAGGLMGPLGYAFGKGAEAFERQSAEFQLGKKLMGDEYGGLEDRSKAIELGASYFDDPNKLEGLLRSQPGLGFARPQVDEMFEPEKSTPSVVGNLFGDLFGGALDFLGVTRKKDEPKPPVYSSIADMKADTPVSSSSGSVTFPVTPPPSFQAEDNGSDLASQLEQEVISNSWMSDASKDFI